MREGIEVGTTLKCSEQTEVTFSADDPPSSALLSLFSLNVTKQRDNPGIPVIR